MADIVVTVPKSFQYKGLKGLAAWVSEGDPAGEEWSGTEWGFFMRGNPPTRISPGERVYVVCENKLRGYSPLIRIHNFGSNQYALIRRGDAVAVTLEDPIKGFQGYRYRWWDRKDEIDFPDWMTP